MLERQRLARIETAKAARPATDVAPAPVAKLLTSADVAGAAVNPEVIEARDAAVRSRLKSGPATFDELLLAMPVESLTEPQLREALTRSLSRLRIKTREVRMLGDGEMWGLTS